MSAGMSGKIWRSHVKLENLQHWSQPQPRVPPGSATLRRYVELFEEARKGVALGLPSFEADLVSSIPS
eukprot:3837045-Amphidinium_carterae.1